MKNTRLETILVHFLSSFILGSFFFLNLYILTLISFSLSPPTSLLI